LMVIVVRHPCDVHWRFFVRLLWYVKEVLKILSFHWILEIRLTCKFIILNYEQIKILNSSLFFAILS
jgi:hypothetical protein